LHEPYFENKGYDLMPVLKMWPEKSCICKRI